MVCFVGNCLAPAMKAGWQGHRDPSSRGCPRMWLVKVMGAIEGGRERETVTKQAAGLRCGEQRELDVVTKGLQHQGRWRATEAPATVSLEGIRTKQYRCLCWFQLVWGSSGWRPGIGTSEAGWFAVVS